MHYVLIILLMFAPMRSVQAAQTPHCDMDDMAIMTTDTVIQNSDVAMFVNDGQMHMANDSSMHHMADRSDVVPSTIEHSCCCCDGNSCGNDCDMGVTVLLLMQPSSYLPVYSNIENTILSSANIQIRELTPPSRPPLNLS